MSTRSEVRDIEAGQDCERLVRAFYGRALTDPMIGFIFVDVARLDLEAHVPVIASFWETILLGSPLLRRGARSGRMPPPHARCPLRAAHFERWLVLWRTTVDELFAGERRGARQGPRAARGARVPRPPADLAHG